jgi:DNA-binding PadR family transcriptional regulator
MRKSRTGLELRTGFRPAYKTPGNGGSPITLSPKQQQRDLDLLPLLCILPTHAYDLERQLLAMGAWWSHKGGIHQHLKGLQAQGLVTSAWDFPDAGPARLVYTITEEGCAYVQRVGIVHT